MGTTFKPTLFPHGTLMYLFDGKSTAVTAVSSGVNLLGILGYEGVGRTVGCDRQMHYIFCIVNVGLVQAI